MCSLLLLQSTRIGIDELCISNTDKYWLAIESLRRFRFIVYWQGQYRQTSSYLLLSCKYQLTDMYLRIPPCPNCYRVNQLSSIDYKPLQSELSNKFDWSISNKKHTYTYSTQKPQADHKKHQKTKQSKIRIMHNHCHLSYLKPLTLHHHCSSSASRFRLAAPRTRNSLDCCCCCCCSGLRKPSAAWARD